MDEIEILKMQTADQRVLRFLLSLCPPDVETCGAPALYQEGDIAASLGLKQGNTFTLLRTAESDRHRDRYTPGDGCQLAPRRGRNRTGSINSSNFSQFTRFDSDRRGFAATDHNNAATPREIARLKRMQQSR